MAELVTLKFPTVQALWAFKKELKAGTFKFNLYYKTLTCECSKQQIELAERKYKAIIEPTINRLQKESRL